MRTALTLVWLSAATLALSSCGSRKAPEQQSTAGGKILPHSISDSMLPYDTARSQPPLAKPSAASGKEGAHASGEAAAHMGSTDSDGKSSDSKAAGTAKAKATPAAE